MFRGYKINGLNQFWNFFMNDKLINVSKSQNDFYNVELAIFFPNFEIGGPEDHIAFKNIFSLIKKNNQDKFEYSKNLFDDLIDYSKIFSNEEKALVLTLEFEHKEFESWILNPTKNIGDVFSKFHFDYTSAKIHDEQHIDISNLFEYSLESLLSFVFDVLEYKIYGKFMKENIPFAKIQHPYKNSAIPFLCPNHSYSDLINQRIFYFWFKENDELYSEKQINTFDSVIQNNKNKIDSKCKSIMPKNIFLDIESSSIVNNMIESNLITEVIIRQVFKFENAKSILRCIDNFKKMPIQSKKYLKKMFEMIGESRIFSDKDFFKNIFLKNKSFFSKEQKLEFLEYFLKRNSNKYDKDFIVEAIANHFLHENICFLTSFTQKNWNTEKDEVEINKTYFLYCKSNRKNIFFVEKYNQQSSSSISEIIVDFFDFLNKKNILSENYKSTNEHMLEYSDLKASVETKNVFQCSEIELDKMENNYQEIYYLIDKHNMKLPVVNYSETECYLENNTIKRKYFVKIKIITDDEVIFSDVFSSIKNMRLAEITAFNSVYERFVGEVGRSIKFLDNF